jgi:hypothetical protein
MLSDVKPLTQERVSRSCRVVRFWGAVTSFVPPTAPVRITGYDSVRRNGMGQRVVRGHCAEPGFVPSR